jgi:hypothetical protein
MRNSFGIDRRSQIVNGVALPALQAMVLTPAPMDASQVLWSDPAFESVDVLRIDAKKFTALLERFKEIMRGRENWILCREDEMREPPEYRGIRLERGKIEHIIWVLEKTRLSNSVI